MTIQEIADKMREIYPEKIGTTVSADRIHFRLESNGKPIFPNGYGEFDIVFPNGENSTTTTIENPLRGVSTVSQKFQVEISQVQRGHDRVLELLRDEHVFNVILQAKDRILAAESEAETLQIIDEFCGEIMQEKREWEEFIKDPKNSLPPEK